jgi:pyrimidine-nucleoside phosphorylase
VASIMSKKLAEGIDGLVLDVKCGSGAFMRTQKDARELADSLIRVGRTMGKTTSALITTMAQPLGRTAGNAVEVIESIGALQGNGAPDLMEVTLALGVRMLLTAGVAKTEEDALRTLTFKLASGEAFVRFKDMVRLQGGDVRAIDDPGWLPRAEVKAAVEAEREGFLAAVDAECMGKACLLLGAGRTKTTDRVDPAAGVTNIRKIGDRVARGDRLLTIHSSSQAALDAARPMLKRAFTIADEPAPVTPTVLEVVA